MGLNIGELFVSLGFDVDDTKLKSFNDGMKEAFNGALRLAGVTASVGGFFAVLNNASTTALTLRNLTAEFGYSAKGAQEWVSVLRQANPLLSQEQATGSYENIANYIRSIKLGKGATALNMLGVNYQDNMTPEQIIDAVRARLPEVIRTQGRDFASKWISEIFGTVGAINALELAKDDYQDKARRGVVAEEDLKALVEYRQNIEQLTVEWDKFYTHVMGADVAPHITEILKAFNKDGIMGAVNEIGKQSTYLDGINVRHGMRDGAQAVSDYISDKNLLGGKSDESYEFWKNKGYSDAAAAALVANERRESNFDERAVGDGGRAKGIFQWHPDRVAEMFFGTGIDVRAANHYQQLQAASWELEHTKLASRLKEMNDPAVAGEFVSRKYLRPGVDELAKTREANIRGQMAAKTYETHAETNVTIHIEGSASPIQTAEAVKQHIDDHFKKTLGLAYSQRDQGANY